MYETKSTPGSHVVDRLCASCPQQRGEFGPGNTQSQEITLVRLGLLISCLFVCIDSFSLNLQKSVPMEKLSLLESQKNLKIVR